MLHGPVGSGKTHLSHVWQATSHANRHTGGDLSACQEQAGKGGAICLDINGIIEDEEALLHLMNWVRENGASMLITATQAPNRWEINLPDLSSRLRACNVAELGAPDETILTALLVKLFNDRQISVTESVIRYLLPRLERTFQAITEAVDILDKAAMSEGRAVTVPLARKVLPL